MIVFELTVGLLFAGVMLALLAGRIGLPFPALLAIGGAALALVPGMPDVSVEPGFVLALFVAPLLLDAAFDTSLRDLRENWRPVGTLVFAAVTVTTMAVAVVARALLPDLPWPAAIALGAIVAPPDASAATAVLRRLHPPHRILVILEGESLLNDATALLIFRVALVVLAGTHSVWVTGGLSVFSCVAGVVAGHVLARVYIRLTRTVEDLAILVTLQFLGTFGLWLLADALELSPILTMVAYAMTLAQHGSGQVGARARIVSLAVWEVVVLVLTVLAFILVGLHLKATWGALGDKWPALLFAGTVTATVVASRMIWVMGYNLAVQLKNHLFGAAKMRTKMLPTWRGGVVVGWCGMRGIVTLAAALALPSDMPHRELLVFTAFSVVLVTLVVQGLTLPAVLRWARLADDGPVQAEVRLARAEAARAADGLLTMAERSPARDVLRGIYRRRMAEDVPDDTTLAALHLDAIQAERAALDDLRASDRIGDHAFRQVEAELDWAEVSAQRERERGETEPDEQQRGGPP